MVIRVIRGILGCVLLLVGLPLLLAGGALWFATQHQDPAGGYSASLEPIGTDGHAVVASDVDALLRREAPFVRGGQTTLRLTARTGSGPAFLGLAPATDVARYLADVSYTRIDQVRLARGPLPVTTSVVAGPDAPAGAPREQPFWLASSGTGTLEWSPRELRDQQVALVVMDPAARAPLTVDLTAHVEPHWLGSTVIGLLVLGTVLVLVATALLAWPRQSREIIYVVPPAQVPEVAAHLGVPVPREATGPLSPPPAAEPLPAPPVPSMLPAPPVLSMPPVPSVVPAPPASSALPVWSGSPRAPAPVGAPAPGEVPAPVGASTPVTPGPPVVVGPVTPEAAPVASTSPDAEDAGTLVRAPSGAPAGGSVPGGAGGRVPVDGTSGTDPLGEPGPGAPADGPRRRRSPVLEWPPPTAEHPTAAPSPVLTTMPPASS